MKDEPVTLEKYLMRKQRMFMVMPVHAVVLHKHYFSKQSKRIRKFREIAHGKTFFYGEVTRLARQLEGSIVQSEDDIFFDKRFVFMKEIYQMRRRALRESVELTEQDELFIDILEHNLLKPIVLLPTGDIVRIRERTNPSGADATTENNCIARLLVENYMIIKYLSSLGPEAPRFKLFTGDRTGTNYLGDDRIAGSKAYPEGYLDFYRDNISTTGILVKQLDVTNGPVGAEFAGFRIALSHWSKDVYVPKYRLDKIWFGCFVSRDRDLNITVSRLMAFAFLVYPHYTVFKQLKPIVLAYLQQTKADSHLRQIAMEFWHDESYIQRMWTGLEASADDTRFAIVRRCLEAEV